MVEELKCLPATVAKGYGRRRPAGRVEEERLKITKLLAFKSFHIFPIWLTIPAIASSIAFICSGFLSITPALSSN